MSHTLSFCGLPFQIQPPSFPLSLLPAQWWWCCWPSWWSSQSSKKGLGSQIPCATLFFVQVISLLPRSIRSRNWRSPCFPNMEGWRRMSGEKWFSPNMFPFGAGRNQIANHWIWCWFLWCTLVYSKQTKAKQDLTLCKVPPRKKVSKEVLKTDKLVTGKVVMQNYGTISLDLITSLSDDSPTAQHVPRMFQLNDSCKLQILERQGEAGQWIATLPSRHVCFQNLRLRKGLFNWVCFCVCQVPVKAEWIQLSLSEDFSWPVVTDCWKLCFVTFASGQHQFIVASCCTCS